MLPSTNLGLLASFRASDETSATAIWESADIYAPADRVLGAAAFLEFGYGFENGTWDGTRGRAETVMRTSSLDILSIGQENALGKSRVNFDIRTDVEKEWIQVKQGGKILWEGEVGQDWRRVSVEARPGPLMIERVAPQVGNQFDNQSLIVGRFGAGDCE